MVVASMYPNIARVPAISTRMPAMNILHHIGTGTDMRRHCATTPTRSYRSISMLDFILPPLKREIRRADYFTACRGAGLGVHPITFRFIGPEYAGVLGVADSIIERNSSLVVVACVHFV